MNLQPIINQETNALLGDVNNFTGNNINENFNNYSTLFLVPQMMDSSSNNQTYLVNYPVNGNLQNNEGVVYGNNINFSMYASNTDTTTAPQGYSTTRPQNLPSNIIGQLNTLYQTTSYIPEPTPHHPSSLVTTVPQQSTQLANRMLIPINSVNNTGMYFLPTNTTQSTTFHPQRTITDVDCTLSNQGIIHQDVQQSSIHNEGSIIDHNDVVDISLWDGGKKKKGGRKETHNQIEKRYRMQINTCFSDLENALFPPTPNEAGRTHTKSVVLRAASDTIKNIRSEKEELVRENNLLKRQINEMAMNSCNSCKYKYLGPSTNSYCSRGSNSSKSQIISLLIGVIIFDTLKSTGIKSTFQPFCASHLLPALFLIAWVFLNWKEPTPNSPDAQTIFLAAKNLYNEAIGRYDSQTAHYHLGTCLEAGGVLESTSILNTFVFYLYYLPLVVLNMFFPQVARVLYAIFKPPVSEENTVACSDVSEALCLYLSIICTGNNPESMKSWFWILIKTLNYYYSNQDEIPRDNQLQILLYCSYLFGRSFPPLSKILLEKTLRSCSTNVGTYPSQWIFDSKLRNRWLSEDIDYHDVNNVVRLIIEPSEYYDFTVRFAIKTIQKEYVDYIYYLWDVRYSVSRQTRSEDSLVIELNEKQGRIMSLLSYFGSFLQKHNSEHNGNVITILSDFLILYSPWVTKLKPLNDVEVKLLKPDQITAIDGVVSLIYQATRLLENSMKEYDVWIQSNISKFSHTLSSISPNDYAMELSQVICCVCSEICLELREDVYKKSPSVMKQDPIDCRSKDSTLYIRFGCKISRLEDRIRSLKRRNGERCKYSPIEDLLQNN